MPIDIDRGAEIQVLLVAPTRRDGEVTQSLLSKAGLTCLVCPGLDVLARELESGAGAILLTDEVLSDSRVESFLDVLAKQPPWSDIGVVLLMQGGVQSPAAARAIRALSNVTLLERPSSTRSVVSALKATIRARRRQYQIRDQIESISRAEALSNELRRQLEIAISASELGTFHCEVPLDRIVWNDQCKAHFWLPPDAEVTFDLFYSILHPDDRERTRLAVEACVYGGQNYDIEYRAVSPSGEIRWVRATGSTTYDEHQQPIQFDGTTQDITERKRSEEALRNADRRKNEFLATLAHELRNPLGPLRNSLHLFRLTGNLSPSLDHVREIMERQVDHMVRLIDDLLDVSRISSGKIELRTEPVELGGLIQTAVETVQPLVEAARHELSVSLPAEPIVLQADPVRLMQIIGNLLNNAIKYTNPGGRIWVTARLDEEEAAISVRDTGLGIPPDMLSRIFDLFAQVDETITRAQGGLGIGLTLTKSFVEMHGGRIEAHSGGVHQGSEFTVHLPLSRNSQPVPMPAQAGRETGSRLSRRRILVVDDTHAAGHVLGKLLETMGQQVRTADSALSALESARSERPDLIISDIAMPKMNGYELAQHLRREPELKDVVLVALTGYGQDGDKQRAKEAGFDHHIVKPVSLETLQNLLASLPAGA